ncbi:MAG: TetR/AcrR family transcriptional regulator [Actinomycetota bacterium]|nr:TetR/AcrR family transcriptional regulator [Actinomycetota bacterium]
MIDEVLLKPRGKTRAQQRAASRQAILEATTACLVEDGYAGLTTRRVAERAGVAQSTLMHHFPTRESLLIEAVTDLALTLADDALDQLDLSALREPKHREAVIDAAWKQFTTPQALAAAQLWVAAWSEPELAKALRDLERRIEEILAATSATLFPDQFSTPEWDALLDAAISLIRGLLMAIPISGRAEVERRWQAIKPLLLTTADRAFEAG